MLSTSSSRAARFCFSFSFSRFTTIMGVSEMSIL
jgi:hypothetical protein